MTSFVGENYNLFNELCQTSEESVEKIQEGILEYTKWIDEGDIWHEDYAFLTCTNPPQWDNNPPDAALPDLIRQYNSAGYGYIIRFATPEMLYQRLQKQNIETLPTHSGDWTDYWNFGCASTAREVKISRKAKSLLLKNDFLECVNEKPSEKRFQKITEEAYQNSLIFEEHTWGASSSISNPTGEHTLAQLNHKKEYAYNAADLSAYMVNYQLDRMANNPWQSKKYDGVLLVNPTGVTLQHQLKLPDHIAQDTPRKLKATRVKGLLPYDVISTVPYGTIEMPPFTAKRIPLAQLEAIHDKKAAGCQIDETKIETPFYCIELRPETKFIRQITEKATGHKLIHEESEWGFFDLIEENTDERYASPSRENLYRTDVMERYHGISNWNHDWKATRRGIDKLFDFHVEENGENITLCYRSESKTLKNIEQRITFSTVHKAISLDVTFDKTAVCDPEGIYFAFPLHLDADWECVYDTMDAFVKLDEQQLGAMCRDYLTIDKSISLFDKNFGYTLACPDAPMVQVGDFRFAKETRQVERNENPLLLAWPLNNYWCTNFAPSQDGKMSFHYELSTFEAFDEKEAYRAGVQAAALCAVGEIVGCSQAEENEFIHFESETSSILFIRPLYHEAGWLVAVKNFSAHEGNCKISIPGRQITFAAVTDIPGNVKEELNPIGNKITITQNPNAITFLKLQF